MADKQVSRDCGATIRKPTDGGLIEAVQRHALSELVVEADRTFFY